MNLFDAGHCLRAQAFEALLDGALDFLLRRFEIIEGRVVPATKISFERAMSWYYYLDQRLQFPFLASCIAYRPISPLEIKDEVTVIGMAPESECEREIFVMIEWGRKGLGVPMSQLVGIKVDKETRQAIGDWHYWVKKGHEY